MTAPDNPATAVPGSDGEHVTIYDVAEEAGVSASTVSRAFSRPDRVSSRTAERVRQAAERLGYRRDLDTRPKPATRTKALGMIMADVTNPFFQDVLRGAEHAARVQDYVVLSVDTAESVPRAQRAAERLVPLVDALLLVSSRLSNGEIQKIARQLPTVSINRPVHGVPSVLVDNYAGAINAAVHLHEQGARSVTYLAGPNDSWADGVRWRGLLDAVGTTDPREGDAVLTRTTTLPTGTLRKLARMQMRQLRVDEPTVRGGRRAFEIWRTHPTDAVLCFNNMVAIGFMNQAETAGAHIPDDILVVAFDNTELSGLVTPGLTTVAGPSRSVGRVAAANALALAEGLRSPLTKPRVLPTRLVLRGSSVRRD
ncbi:LacI family DNA-binding transcriptional regulator [Corynebacterium guangdongense]|uniref:LacI family transcriptional regulator n=1 Tax=Corynebacterium guangdongense TaxID=1783348 RepID=A0ABU1ZZ73_9CORY|nr:LacI family DNA-binding transcriptional regulator [Corynebacterium guangdongense]MDR7330145.1 LacI family transcriptional regulator [Corynebacterium guangdongense]WJZ18703.1 HTH-type transcriptional repressor CytR [Corynebacterium guangdongense]